MVKNVRMFCALLDVEHDRNHLRALYCHWSKTHNQAEPATGKHGRYCIDRGPLEHRVHDLGNQWHMHTFWAHVHRRSLAVASLAVLHGSGSACTKSLLLLK